MKALHCLPYSELGERDMSKLTALAAALDAPALHSEIRRPGRYATLQYEIVNTALQSLLKHPSDWLLE